MGLVRRSVVAGAKAGMAAGVVYFFVLATLAFFGSVLTSDTVNLLELVLFIGVGAGCGLGLGVVAGAVTGLALRAAVNGGRPGAARLRLVAAVAAGLPVLLLTAVELVTGAVGVLSPEPTTVVVLPTLVAAVVGASSAPGLVARAGQPKRPET